MSDQMTNSGRKWSCLHRESWVEEVSVCVIPYWLRERPEYRCSWDVTSLPLHYNSISSRIEVDKLWYFHRAKHIPTSVSPFLSYMFALIQNVAITSAPSDPPVVYPVPYTISSSLTQRRVLSPCGISNLHHWKRKPYALKMPMDPCQVLLPPTLPACKEKVVE
jgi:hypothetical protein